MRWSGFERLRGRPVDLVGAFERIFGATIFFGTGSFSGNATVVQRSRVNFMREAQIWYSREHPDHRTLSSEFENVIVLSREFYQQLIMMAGVKVIRDWVGAIRALWPECPARLSSDGQAINSGPTRKLKLGNQVVELRHAPAWQ